MAVMDLIRRAEEIWTSGGWAMIPLAINAFILCLIGMNLWFDLQRRGPGRVSEATWRRWLTRPEERRGHVGEMIDFVMGSTDLKELEARFGELRTTEVAPFSRDLKFMRICVGTAPLLGLLGTVTGMLTTFDALAGGAGGQETMTLMAGGISEALITTETGLVIALPGLFMAYHLTRRRERFEAFLAHLETACMQLHCVRRQVERRAGEPRPIPSRQPQPRLELSGVSS